ncbi:sigma-54 interaction domain-containing protein [Amphritea sp.]|uniref:sigma-54 interaction domain-containing protein n=1 Tax=Amphritea sp. TaxID=1872502 RepID=UPI003A952156
MIKKRILLSWLGRHDLDAVGNELRGPIASILLDSDAPFDEVRILANNWKDEIEGYQQWLTAQVSKQNRKASISIHFAKLESPIHYPSIYNVANDELQKLSAAGSLITLNLSSGTPAMIATWLLLGKGVFNTQLVQTSVQSGLSMVELPFDIALAYLDHQDGVLGKLAASSPALDSYFEHIQSHSVMMNEAIEMAKRLAPRNLPVIIQGDSGTGKEVVAKAIHKASPRSGKSFIPVNCGAIPETLIDSQLFGHKRGAFTGADADRKGFFDEADGGTLFLDEIGELPLEAQAKLLRALQEKEINAVGSSKPHKIDVRVIAATHRDLLAMIEEGSFREDLFYRLAVGIVHLPRLRERGDDIPELLMALMDQLNREAEQQPGYKSKKLSESAIEFIKQQGWPGNIRELWNTLLRASIWSEGEILEVEHLQRAMIQRSRKADQSNLDIDVSLGVNLAEIIDNTKRYCIEEALRLTSGQKGKAAKLLGLSNHQTLTNWIDKLDINE